MPGLHAGPSFSGNLWLRTNQKLHKQVFCVLSLSESTLSIFESESALQPTQVLTVQGGQLVEIKLHSAGRQMFERALLLKATERKQPVSLLDGFEPALQPQPCERVFTAEDGMSHSHWQRHLQKAIQGGDATNGAAKSDKTLQLNKRSRASSLFGPSPLVVMRLCCAGREFGKQLLQRLKQARRSFEEGLRDLTIVGDKARLAQRGLYDVHSLLLTIGRTLADSHHSDDQSEADIEALDRCREWISSVQAFVMDLDHQVDTMLQREAAAQLPGNWCTFAQNSMMQLRDIEDAMQVGQQQWRRLNGSDSCQSSQQRVRCATTPRSCMPYNGHWARATAI